MATHWKKQLADAHHEVRKLKNRVHELEAEILKNEFAIKSSNERADLAEQRALEDAAELARTRASQDRSTPDRRPLALIEQAILALCAALETMPETPARRRLIDRLVEAILGKDGS